MKNLSTKPQCIITHSYTEYHPQILKYISYRINHKYEAEDLAQDVFIRLLDYKPMLRPETVKYFIFRIAHNLVIDYLRRYYKKQEVTSYIYENSRTYTHEPEQHIIANDILSLEARKLDTFPAQRRLIYSLTRFEDKSVTEISEEYNLSKRTVENHLRMGRKVMRGYMRQCV